MLDASSTFQPASSFFDVMLSCSENCQSRNDGDARLCRPGAGPTITFEARTARAQKQVKVKSAALK